MNAYVRPTAALRVSRRSVIVQAGVAAAALTGLTACGGSSTDAPAPGSAGSATGGESAAGGGLTAKVSDIPVGSGMVFDDAKTVITQPSAGEFKAFTSICTHSGCPVAAVTDTINCNCHGSKFSITDGSVVSPPADQPLAEKTVTLDQDTLTVS